MTLSVYIPNADAVLFQGKEVPDKESLPSDDERLIELNEWETYYLKFYDQVTEDFIGKHFSRLPGNQFEINYRNFVGHSRILGRDVRVQSRKISEDAYDRMLHDITDRYASLIFSFDSPTGTGYEKKAPGKDHSYVEFLFLKHFLLDRSPDIDAVMGLILSNPHHRLEEAREVVGINNARFFTPNDVASTVSNADNYGRIREDHPLAATSLAQTLQRRTRQSLYLNRCRQTRKYVTHDTPENRFVKFFVLRLITLVDSFRDAFPGSDGTVLNPSFPAAAKALSRKLSHFLSAPLWQEVGPLESIPESSTVLHARSGYCDLFRLYSLLQLATRYRAVDHDLRKLIETKDLPLLYEYWCLFQTMDVLQEALGEPIDRREVTDMAPQEQHVRHGLEIRYREQVVLHFNLSCGNRENAYHSSYSHTFRPDIVVSRGQRKLIFDAKAKGEKIDFGGEETDGRIGKYKNEDIDKMHTYREAINDVFGAYILYPGTTTQFFSWPDGRSEFEGVGAIALKPGASDSGVDAVRNAILEFLR